MPTRRGVRIGGVFAFASVVGLALATSCLSPTEVTLDLSTDVPCSMLTGTSIALGTPTDVETNQPVTITNACDPTGNIGTFVVIPNGSSTETFAVQVIAAVAPTVVSDCARNGYKNCIVARRELAFIPHTPLSLPIELANDCLGVACTSVGGALETCVPGKGCVLAMISSCPKNACLIGPPDDDAAAHPEDASDESMQPDRTLPGDEPDGPASSETSMPLDGTTSDDRDSVEVGPPETGVPPEEAGMDVLVPPFDAPADAPIDAPADARPDATAEASVDASIDAAPTDASDGSVDLEGSSLADAMGACIDAGTTNGTVACGGGRCTGGEICCVYAPTVGYATEGCTTASACDTQTTGSFYSALGCRTWADCPSGEVCCVTPATGGVVSSCTAGGSCTGVSKQRMCENQCECASGTCSVPVNYPCANMNVATCGGICP